MTTFRRHDEMCIRNGHHHIFGQVRRCERIAVPNKDGRRHGYGGKAGTAVDSRDKRLDLPRKSIDANRQTHAYIDFTNGRIVLRLRVQYHAQALR